MARTEKNKNASACTVMTLLTSLLSCLLPVTVLAETDSGMQQLRLAIDVAIGDPQATSVGQCRVIAFGVKPCGGPREYLVYSIDATEESTVRDLVAQYNRCEQQRNERLGLMSDCEFVKKPLSTLRQGRCYAK